MYIMCSGISRNQGNDHVVSAWKSESFGGFCCKVSKNFGLQVMRLQKTS